MAPTTNDLTDVLARALTADRVQTMADREQRDDMVWLVLNPGCYSAVGNQRFGPGQAILVDEEQADRLTSRVEYRDYPSARPLDEPEPDARGNFLQVHGPGAFHPKSKKHKDPKERPLKAGDGQRLVGGELQEPGSVDEPTRAASDAERAQQLREESPTGNTGTVGTGSNAAGGTLQTSPHSGLGGDPIAGDNAGDAGASSSSTSSTSSGAGTPSGKKAARGANQQQPGNGGKTAG